MWFYAMLVGKMHFDPLRRERHELTPAVPVKGTDPARDDVLHKTHEGGCFVDASASAGVC